MMACTSIQTWAAHLIVVALVLGALIGLGLRFVLDYAELRGYRRIARLRADEIDEILTKIHEVKATEAS